MRTLVIFTLLAVTIQATGAGTIELTGQTRDPDSGKIVLTADKVAGADENVVGVSNGSNLAKYPSVVFKRFIDGKEAAASPVMRVQSLAWRFDVPIPAGAKIISLAVMDAGDGSREDFAD